ncbi:AsnC family transcriptional regulator [Gordonia sp. NPDC003425]
MGARSALNSAVLDAVDTQIARAVQISPRVSFREIADVLGIAEQTVARRYRRMRRDGLLRVTMATDPRALGNTAWLVRVRCRPEGADAIASALAARDDVSWVSIYGAGWEVVFNLRSADDASGSELLTRTLPKAAPVLDVTPAAVLHTFAGGTATDWDGWRGNLTPAQAEALVATRIPRDDGPPRQMSLDAADRALLDELTRDGRTPYSTLARTLGSTPGRITRRVEQLVASGMVYFDVDLAAAAIGLQSTALWLTVEPRHLTTVGDVLASHPDIPFAVAVTGRANISANVMVGDTDDLYRFVTGVLASAPGITSYQLVPLLRRIKNAGSLVAGDRLAPPAAPRSMGSRAGSRSRAVTIR